MFPPVFGIMIMGLMFSVEFPVTFSLSPSRIDSAFITQLRIGMAHLCTPGLVHRAGTVSPVHAGLQKDPHPILEGRPPLAARRFQQKFHHQGMQSRCFPRDKREKERHGYAHYLRLTTWQGEFRSLKVAINGGWIKMACGRQGKVQTGERLRCLRQPS